MITTDTLDKLIKGDRSRQDRIAKQRAYLLGQNPAILEPEPKENPDNRVPVPFPRRAVEIVSGYLGKPGNIVYKGSAYTQEMKDLYKTNDADTLTGELLRTACAYGDGWELHWLDASKNKNFAQVPIAQAIAIYDNKLKKTLTDFIRYWTETAEDGNKYYIAEVYDKTSWAIYSNQGGASNWVQIQAPKLHGYQRVPVAHYAVDPDGQNIFDHCTALIDFYDKLISENYANDLQSLSSAILLLANKLNTNADDSEDGISDAEKVIAKRVKYLDGLSLDGIGGSITDKVAYLTKNVDPNFPGSAEAIVYRLIYEMLQLFNPNDEAFSTPSGVAAQYKLIGFEYLCTKITTYFIRGLRERFELLTGVGFSLTGESAKNDIEIDWQRNLPKDVKEIADIAAAVNGLLSQETILGMFPSYIVPDPKKELKRVEDEKAKRVESAARMVVRATTPRPGTINQPAEVVTDGE